MYTAVTRLLIPAYALFALLLGLALVVWNLPDQLLVALMLPPAIVAYLGRRISYLTMIAVFVPTTTIACYFVSPIFSESVRTIVAATAGLLVTCETICFLSQRRHDVENALRDTETRFRAIAEQSLVGIYMYRHGRVVFMNQAMERLTGYGADEVCSWSPERVAFCIHEDDREFVLEQAQRKCAGNGQAIQAYDFRIFTAQGSIKWISLMSKPVRFEDGHAILAMAMDITQRKKGEEERALLYRVMGQAAEGIVVTDNTGIVQYTNPAFERTSGYAQEEVLGKYLRDLVDNGLNTDLIGEVETCVRGGVSWQGRVENKRKDGTRYVSEVMVSPAYGPGNSITNFVHLSRDVTKEVELETQLRESQKLEAIGQLAAGVAHDFNNLLVVILGCSQAIRERMAPDDPRFEEVQEIRRAGERAAVLTRQLLAFSRRHVLQPMDLDLNQLVANLIKLLRRVIRENVEIDVVSGDDLGVVVGDPGQIEQVLINLVVNASDAIRDGGRITLETRSVFIGEESQSPYPDVQLGRYAVIRVTDTGGGVALEIRDRIFEPFFTTKEPGRGTGLGLATVYGIVKQHGGHIHLASGPEEPTTFEVHLPAKRGDALVEAVETEEGDPRGTETVLVVEDDAAVRDIVRNMLTRAGYRVLLAKDGVEAVRVFEDRAHDVDLVLCDVIMPNMNGFEARNRIKSLREDTRFLFTSGYSFSVVQEMSGNFVPDFILTKPFAVGELLKRVREALDA